MNEFQQNRFVKTILSSMFNTIAGKRIAVLGFAFKADTGDTRESPAISVCKELATEQAQVVVSDPKALDNAEKELADSKGIVFDKDPYAAAAGAHALAILTEWEIYKALDYQRIFNIMEKPAFIFDGRNILDHTALHKIGFEVYSIGKGRLTHLD